MNEIKSGEYIRTINGEIEKVVFTYDNRYMNEDGNMTHFDEIKAHSKNIIDLIEEGDYVNGRKVYQVGYNFQDDLVLKMSESNYENFIYPNEIKTILTHEQYEQNCHRVGDIE